MNKPHLKDGLPDISQPKVRKQVTDALAYALGHFSFKPREYPSALIRTRIGRNDTPIGRWLRSNLITCVDDHYSFVVGNSKAGKMKWWILDEDGVTRVKQLLGYQGKPPTKDPQPSPHNSHHQSSPAIGQVGRKCIIYDTLDTINPQPSPHNSHHQSSPAIGQVGRKCIIYDTLDTITLDRLVNPPLPYLSRPVRLDSDIDTLLISRWAQAEFGHELQHLVFEYEDKSSRLWHPLQMMRRAHKREVQAAAQLTWHYDIEACAPTLLLQHAQSLPEPMDLWLQNFTAYLQDRAYHRQRLAQVMQCDVFFAKAAINALLCGAPVGAGDRFAIGRMLHHAQRVKRFKEDDFIIGLRADIKTLWDYIHPSLGYRFRENGTRVPLSSKRKWNLYFRLERQVLDVVREYLTETGNPHFLEHDGWVTKERVDVTALAERIYQRTGFSVKLEEEHHG